MAVKDVFFRRLYHLNARWLAFGLELEINVMPRQTARGFVQRANIICATCDEHKKHFVSFVLPAVYRVALSSGLIPGIFLQH